MADSPACLRRIIEEEFVELCSNFAHGPSAAKCVSRCGIDTHETCIQKVGPFGKSAVYLAYTGCHEFLFVHSEGHRASESAHGVAGDADDSVARFVLEHVRLLIHIGDSVVHGVHPEGKPDAEEGRVAVF